MNKECCNECDCKGIAVESPQDGARYTVVCTNHDGSCHNKSCDCHTPQPITTSEGGWRERFGQLIVFETYKVPQIVKDDVVSFIASELSKSYEKGREEEKKKVSQIILDFKMSPEGRLRLISDLLTQI